MRSSTRSLINAMRVLDSEIQSDDGVANAVIAEAAERLEEQQERIKRLEQLGDALAYAIEESCDPTFANDVTRWRKNREAME